jgi:heme/copper-type cytochrome/quinol oxidase subunit 2
MAHLLTGRMVMIGGLLALVIDATVAAYAIAVEDMQLASTTVVVALVILAIGVLVWVARTISNSEKPAEAPFVRPIAGDDVIASPSDADFMADLAANVPEFRQAA